MKNDVTYLFFLLPQTLAYYLISRDLFLNVFLLIADTFLLGTFSNKADCAILSYDSDEKKLFGNRFFCQLSSNFQHNFASFRILASCFFLPLIDGIFRAEINSNCVIIQNAYLVQFSVQSQHEKLTFFEINIMLIRHMARQLHYDLAGNYSTTRL